MLNKLTNIQILLAIVLFLPTLSQAQTVTNGRLVFPTLQALKSKIQQLENAVNTTPETTTEIAEGVFYEPYPALDQFEKSMRGFTSLRSIALQDQYTQLRAGKAPEDLVSLSWISDPIQTSLLNVNRTIQVEDTIFYLKNSHVTVKIPKANEQILARILKGENIGKFGKDVVLDWGEGGSEPECSVSVDYSKSFLTSLSGQFTSQGAFGPSATYYWDFGDGTFSEKKNPAKTYNYPGIYTISLTVEDGECTAFDYVRVVVNQACIPVFKTNDGGTPGMKCFNVLLDNLTGHVISYKWRFGDGDSSNLENPCHVFPCDKSYNVTVHVITSNGCDMSFTQNVNVSSYACCDKNIREKDTEFTMELNGGKEKIKGNCKDAWFLGIISNVNAELMHYTRKGIWWPTKANLRVELRGNVYQKDEKRCLCVNPFNIDCEEEKSAWRVSCKKPISGKFRTWLDNPWKANFYKDGILMKTLIPNVSCN